MNLFDLICQSDKISEPDRTDERLCQAYSGGAVPSKLGNLLTENGVKLLAIYGATEFGALSHFIRREGDETDWEYMDFTSDLVNIRWDPQGDGTYECQLIVRVFFFSDVNMLDHVFQGSTCAHSSTRHASPSSSERLTK